MPEKDLAENARSAVANAGPLLGASGEIAVGARTGPNASNASDGQKWAASQNSAEDAAEAARVLRAAVRRRPDHPGLHHDLGVALERSGDLPGAEAAYRRAIELEPTLPEGHNHLGNALRKLGRLSEAVTHHREALRLRPWYAQAYNNLGATFYELGDVDGGLACDRGAVALVPEAASLHSCLLYNLHLNPAVTPRELFEAHLTWARRHAGPIYPWSAGAADTLWHPLLAAVLSPERRPVTQHTYPNKPDPARRLRVGYVSADFRRHTRSLFMEPVLKNHDHGQFQIYCYSDVAVPDETTIRIGRTADVWCETAGLPDSALAELIRRDRIDILVDLTGQMACNRLLVFARKPAPVQVAYPGYPNTTGLATIDYLITDADRDPLGVEGRYTETLIRLHPSSQCYRPFDDAPSVCALPFHTAERFTFGCLNKLAKVTPMMIEAWSRILTAVPNCRLLVLAAEEPAARQLFAAHGIAGAQLEVTGRLPHGRYMALYNRIDLALDTFPYNGHTTTLDALWMGVPSVTLAGETHVSREGLAVLKLVDLEDLVAHTFDAYVDTAVRIASDLGRLADLRASLRGRMMVSSLCDGPGQTRRVEQAYRWAWEQWCTSALTGQDVRRATTALGEPGVV